MSWYRRLARAMRITGPGQNRGGMPLRFGRAAGTTVTEPVAYTVSAFWGCVRVISESISQMPWRVWELTDDGRRMAPQHPADRLLNRSPNAEQDAAVWRELMLRWALTWGNSYAEIVRDGSYRPTSLWPIEPWRVTPVREGGQLWYSVNNPQGAASILPAADMLHFRGIGDDLEGWSVIWYMSKALGLSASLEDSMAAQMEHGSRLSGILTPAGGGRLPKERAKSIESQWNAQNTGARQHGRVVLLDEGVEFKPFSMPNTDAQLLESRAFSVVDICRFMRVPPHLVYDLARATFSNITQQSLEFLIHTLGPWICKFEQQANRKLVAIQGRYETDIDAKRILRMDPETRVKYYQGLRDLGAISPNEVRREEGFNSLGPDGDLYVVPVNMQPINLAANPPKQESITRLQTEQKEGKSNGRRILLRGD